MEPINEVAEAVGIDASAVYVVGTAEVDEAMRMQGPYCFEAGIIGAAAVADLPDTHRRQLVHNLVGHLAPGGLLLTPCEATADLMEPDAGATGLTRCEPIAGHHGWRRDDRHNIHDYLAAARGRIRRWTVSELHEAQSSNLRVGQPVVLDIRTPTDRDRDGVIGDSIHAPRTVLEWRVDPASGYSLAEIHSFDQPLVIVCSGGYSSSLAAATLVDLGFANAGDLVGGIDAWRRAGLPLITPTHHFTEEPL